MYMYDDDLFSRLLNERLHERKLSASKLARKLGLHRSTVSRWLNGETKPEPQVLTELADYLVIFGTQRERLLLAYHGQVPTLPVASAPFASGAAWPVASRMNLPQNPLFVGRTGDLSALADRLSEPLATVALMGMAGVGKTQLAVELVYRLHARFPGGVFWLRCANGTTLPAEVAACAEPLGLAAHDDRDVQVRRVLAAWQQPTARLLIFDNCEDEALLAGWRPSVGGCRVLITSRRAWWSPTLAVQSYPLGPFLRHESIALLRGLIAQRASGQLFDQASLATIAAELGDLPLALNLAGHFLSQYRHGVAPTAYAEQLRAPEQFLLAHPSLQSAGYSPTGHPQSLAQTFALSYDKLDPAQPSDSLARSLLARVACCAPGEPVPLDLLGDALPTPVAALELEGALLRLSDDLGLLERIDAQHVQVHRLIAAFVRQYSEDPAAAEQVGQALLGRFTIPNYSELPGDPQWVRHLHALADLRFTATDTLAAKLCYAMGEYLWAGQDPMAVRYWERAAALCTTAYGANDLRTAEALNGLGLSLHLVAAQARAAETFAQVVAIRAAHLPANHFDLLMCKANLGFAQILLGEYCQAEATIYEVQHGLRRERGLRDHFTLRNIHNRGVLRLIIGRYRDARRLLALSCSLREVILSPEHPALAKSYTYVGETLARLGDLAAAQIFQTKALTIRRALFGAESHVVAENLRMQGLLRVMAGEVAGGLADLEQAVKITRQRLLPGHDEILLCLEALGVGRWRAGERPAAQALFEEGLASWEQSRGCNHVHTALCHHMLGLLAWADSKRAKATTSFERSLTVSTGALSPCHPELIRTRQALAALRAGAEPELLFIPWPTLLPL